MEMSGEEHEAEDKTLLSSDSRLSGSDEITLVLSQDQEDETPPKDPYHVVYFVFILVSVGILSPYNSYILAIDYFNYLYPGQHPELVLPLVYLLTTVVFTFITIGITNFVPLHGRIGFGYILFGISLLFVPLLDIGVNNCTVSTAVGFVLTLASFVVVGMGSGFQQPSYYGLAGMLPEKYTQAMMIGESIAGTIVSIARVITKLAAASERGGAIAFFITSFVFIVFCFVCQVYLSKSSFVRYFISKSSSRPFANINLSDVVATNDSKDIKTRSITSTFHWIISGVKLRIKILKKVWKQIVSVFTIFFVTLLVFPSLPSEVQYCAIGDWTPVILATVFNFTDFISRCFSRLPIHFNHNWLIVISCLRLIIFVPLLLLCVSPSPTFPIIPNPFWLSLVVIGLVGITNGYFGTLPMQHAPQMVEKNERELTGVIMVFFLLSGLSVGSIIANIWRPLTSLKPVHRCLNNTEKFYCQIIDNITNLY